MKTLELKFILFHSTDKAEFDITQAKHILVWFQIC